ncbi:hypothetical protein JKP88DRAFT_227518 [Tribonema minus]|uniref:Fungal lipase-type domain-containing protein n=1 Tax=Tribonema minus TaxID=303371 RepID=A0A835YUB0_9STRA|nr:hypothetical protein JKP88DRAFT_227518 [Tribonema minus]
MYNYGSPRVGNKAFVELYNQLNGDSFRLVNNLDIVTSLPRQALASMLAEYDHVGRTVVVDHEGVPGNVWVEGIDEGECPVRLRDAARAQKGLIETEMALLQSIVAGEAVSQHLEPYYFVALCAAVGLDPPEQFAALRSSDGPSNWVWTA